MSAGFHERMVLMMQPDGVGYATADEARAAASANNEALIAALRRDRRERIATACLAAMNANPKIIFGIDEDMARENPGVSEVDRLLAREAANAAEALIMALDAKETK